MVNSARLCTIVPLMGWGGIARAHLEEAGGAEVTWASWSADW